jgi:hypothetical protein
VTNRYVNTKIEPVQLSQQNRQSRSAHSAVAKIELRLIAIPPSQACDIYISSKKAGPLTFIGKNVRPHEIFSPKIKRLPNPNFADINNGALKHAFSGVLDKIYTETYCAFIPTRVKSLVWSKY